MLLQERGHLLIVGAVMRVSLLCAALAAAAWLCGSASATLVIFDQGPYNPELESRNSNTNDNAGSNQQIADDFSILGTGLEVTQVDFWFTYQFNGNPPANQVIILRIFDDVDQNPGEKVFEEIFTVTPLPTGDGNAFPNDNMIYSAELVLTDSFLPESDETYWLSPLGFVDSATLQWQIASEEGTHRARGGVGPEDWRSVSVGANPFPLTEDFAFRLHGIPEPSSLALLATFGVFGGLRRRRR